MILSQEQWMELRAFKALAEAGATWAEIARETGYDWRTVKRYLSADAGSSPPAPAKRGPGPRKTDPYAHLIDAWLRAQPKLKASVIWERLVTEHGFDGHYQRVKVYVRRTESGWSETQPTRLACTVVSRSWLVPRPRSTGATRASSRPRSGRCTPTAST
jgi:hypothetical protein